MHISRTVRFDKLLGLAAVLAIAALPACEGPKGSDGADGTNGTSGVDGTDGTNGTDGTDGTNGVIDQNLPPLEKAFAGVGGVEALDALTTLQARAEGARWMFGEGYMPDDPAVKVSTFMVDVAVDIPNQGMRLDYNRHIEAIGFIADTEFSEILFEDLGVVDGTEHLFGIPGGPMTSDRWASTRKQQMILHPHLLLKEAAANADLVLDDTGVGYLDGSVHHLLVLDNPISPITLWVNRQTGWISKLSFVENEPLLRDVHVEALYYGWDSVESGGLRFPSDVYIAVDEMIVHQERRSTIEANAAIAAGTFDFPAGANPMYVAEDAHRGEANHQFHQLFASLGIPLDGQQTFVAPTELATGVWFLGGGSHNTLVIDQQDGLVMIDAPLDEGRQEAILGWIGTQFPGKPISHVVVSHHHSDHQGGIRTIAATGARAVVSEVSADFFQDVFDARSSVTPDALAMAGLQVSVVEVEDGGSMVLADNAREVHLFHMATQHAADMLLVYVPSAELVFTVDLFSPGPAPLMIPPPFVNPGHELVAGIQAAGIMTDPTVLRIAGGHGVGTNTLAELEAALP